MTYAVFQRELRFEGRITQALQMVLEEEDQAAVESSLFSGTRRWKSGVRALSPAGAPDTAERIGMDAWSPLSNIPGSFPQKVALPARLGTALDSGDSSWWHRDSPAASA